MPQALDETYWSARLDQALAMRHGGTELERTLLPPHGSQRRYARVSLPDGATEVVMLLPPRESSAAELGGTTVEQASDEPFVHIASWLQRGGVRVPRVKDVDDDARAIWLEDLGDTNLDDAIACGLLTIEQAYARALALLADFQSATRTAAPPAIVHQRELNPQLLRDELEHYVDWRTGRSLQRTLHAAQRDALDRAFSWIVEALETAPTALVHRDFQSHNIMVLDERKLALIDFQDVLSGPLPYDAVALLRDSYVELPTALLTRLLALWASATHDTLGARDPSADRLVQYFHLQTIQRKLKDTGRFELFRLAQNKPGFAQYIPTNVRYLRYALDELHEVGPLRELASVLADIEPEFRP